MRDRCSWPLLLALFAAILVQPAHAAATAKGPVRIVLKGDAGGPRFDGIGVVDGGGGTSVLLKDYPDPQRSQILDLIYKPKFGASVHTLYVEIPGDGNSTQGSMPSHMHTRDDLNFSRGYTWWVMQQAKQRNSALTLDGTGWSLPGWIGDNGRLFAQNTGSYYKGDKNFFSQDAVDYYIKWLGGLRSVYGMEFDAIGMRNEKGVSYDFIKALRGSLNQNGFGKVKVHAFDNWPDAWKFNFVKDMEADPALRDAIDVISAHVNAPKSAVPAEIRAAAARMGKPIWNTEQHVYKAGFDGLISMVEAFNENYVRSGVTKVVLWYGIAGLYTMQPYSGEKEAIVRANWPWSGHFSVNPNLWAYAHYGQFSELGWTYLDGGSGDLPRGGTYVTLKSPGTDYSVIVETKEASGPQQVRLEIAAGLSGGALAVWRSNEKEQFIRQADVAPVDGVATLTLDADSVYSITTTRGQRKGGFDQVPARAAFPFPYIDTFDHYGDPRKWGYLPRYFADISGAFELSGCPERSGGCLRQGAPKPTISWGPDWQPYTIIGDDQWDDYEVSADLYLNPGDSAAVMGRVNNVGTGYGIIPKGYFAQLHADGQLKLVVVRGKVDKKALVGDSEQQALIRAQNDASVGGEKVLATARVEGVAPGRWHQLKLQFKGTAISATVDGKRILSVKDELYAKGMAGLMAGREQERLSTPSFDNVEVNRPGAKSLSPATVFMRQTPIYK